MNTKKSERIAEMIRELASEIILYNLSDPRVKSVTVTKVKMSRDNKYAKIFISVLGNDADKRTAFSGLKHAAPHIQREIGKSLSKRVTPKISFHFDESIEGCIRISKLLDEISKDTKEDAEEE
jgi:ribosome-binding factor A